MSAAHLRPRPVACLTPPAGGQVSVLTAVFPMRPPANPLTAPPGLSCAPCVCGGRGHCTHSPRGWRSGGRRCQPASHTWVLGRLRSLHLFHCTATTVFIPELGCGDGLSGSTKFCGRNWGHTWQRLPAQDQVWREMTRLPHKALQASKLHTVPGPPEQLPPSGVECLRVPKPQERGGPTPSCERMLFKASRDEVTRILSRLLRFHVT